MLNTLLDLVCMNWTQWPNCLALVDHKGLDKYLSWLAVLSLKSLLDILRLGFQRLFDTLAVPLGTTLIFRTILNQWADRIGLDSFAHAYM